MNIYWVNWLALKGITNSKYQFDFTSVVNILRTLTLDLRNVCVLCQLIRSNLYEIMNKSNHLQQLESVQMMVLIAFGTMTL